MNPDQNSDPNYSPVALVTGGAGFIGSHLTDLLVGRNRQVHVVDNRSGGPSKHVNPRAYFHNLDVGDSALQDLIAEIEPDVIYHLAAQVSVAVSAKDPLLDANVNVMGTLNVLDAAVSLDPSPKFVYTSTGGAIYGYLDEDELPANETIETRPMSPYGASKLAIENYLPVYEHLHGLRYCIVRPANVYGPRQDPHGEAGVIAIFAKAMLEGRELTIFGDGNDERDYIYVSDFVAAMAMLGEGEGKGPYNIASGEGISVNEIYRSLQKLTGYDRAPTYGPPRLGDIRKIKLDSSRAHKELGWRQTTSFDHGLKKTVEWFRSDES